MSKINCSVGNLLTCMAEILIGILLLIDPVGFTAGIFVVLGAVLTILGIASLVSYFRSDPVEAAQKSGLAKGLLLVMPGLLCAFRFQWLIAAFPLLTSFYGILTLMLGVSKVQGAMDMLRLKQKYWFIAVIGAILTLLFAALILANPFASTAVLWTFIAVTLIIEAVIDILAFIFGKR